MSERVGRGAARLRSRGFSLIELLVVVIIIGILAALAIPTMSTARYDREAYSDAGGIMMLFRQARMRAIARGGAEMIQMTANGTADRGTFVLWEAVTMNPSPGATGAARLPAPHCSLPTIWQPLPSPPPQALVMLSATQGIVAIDGVNLNTGTTTLEGVADIETQLYMYPSPANSAPVAFNTGYVCFAPSGRSYVNAGGGSQPVFDGLLPSVGVIEARVLRGVTNGTPSGQIRSVLLPPNGMARLFSHT